MTKREVLQAMVIGTLAQEDVVAFAEHELALLDKRAAASKKESKITREIKDTVFNALVGHEDGISLKDLIAEDFPDKGFTSQKLVPVMKALIAEDKVERTMVKRTAIFKAIG